jgi:DNA-binding transcriptional LysR family regulator
MQSRDLQIDWLRTFLAVVDTGSVTAAARQVSRSQSAVSMQLKKLEDSVGRRLLNRGPKQMSLTPTGLDLLAHARKLLEVHSTALMALHGASVSGRVSLGVPDDYVIRYLAPVLSTFSNKYSGVQVTLVCEPSTTLLARLTRGELDLALMTRDTPTRGELLFHEDLVWVASEQHEAWKHEPLPLALHGIDSRLRSGITAALSARQRKYRVVYNSPNVAGQLAVAASGMAVAIITRCCVPRDLKVLDGRHGLPDLPQVEVALARSKESRLSAAVDAMYDHATRSLKSTV